jgi:hypothetical protein
MSLVEQGDTSVPPAPCYHVEDILMPTEKPTLVAMLVACEHNRAPPFPEWPLHPSVADAARVGRMMEEDHLPSSCGVLERFLQPFWLDRSLCGPVWLPTLGSCSSHHQL